jgi:hypothetical protein
MINILFNPRTVRIENFVQKVLAIFFSLSVLSTHIANEFFWQRNFQPSPSLPQVL